MGWKLEVPLSIVRIWLDMVVTWLLVVTLARPASDWTTAMTFGQLLTASMSVIEYYHVNTDNAGEPIRNRQHNMEGIGSIIDLGRATMYSSLRHPWMRSGIGAQYFE